MPPTLTNATFGPYVVRELISAGGIAEVYRVQHREDGSESAVKIMRPERQAEKHHHKAFLDEFAVLNRLQHPGIPRARRLDELKGRACMVLELIPGTPLHTIPRGDKRLDPLAVFVQLVGIVAYLHGEGVVHNDLKLENIILRPDGRIGLVDFGNARVDERKGLLARLLQRRTPLFGTPTYLAPELIAGEGEPSLRSDLYSLGVCCWMLCVGEPPFAFDRKSARLRAIVTQEAPSIRSKAPALSLSFTRLIDGCLAKDPKRRLADAGQLDQALKMVAKAGLTQAIPSIEL